MFSSRGKLFVALLRLMFIPFGLVSYLLGVSSLSITDFMIGTSSCIVKVSMFVFLGCTLYNGSVSANEDKTTWYAVCIEITMTMTASICITIFARSVFYSEYAKFE